MALTEGNSPDTDFVDRDPLPRAVGHGFWAQLPGRVQRPCNALSLDLRAMHLMARFIEDKPPKGSKVRPILNESGSQQ